MLPPTYVRTTIGQRHLEYHVSLDPYWINVFAFLFFLFFSFFLVLGQLGSVQRSRRDGPQSQNNYFSHKIFLFYFYTITHGLIFLLERPYLDRQLSVLVCHLGETDCSHKIYFRRICSRYLSWIYWKCLYTFQI